MSIIYDVLEKIVPFQWISYDFMKNALIAVLIITPWRYSWEERTFPIILKW